MGRNGREMDPGHVQDYLRRRGFEGARIVAMTPLGQDSQAGLKTYGYGRPLKVAFVHEGRTRYVVLRTMAPDPFGHDRRSDRARVLLDAHDVAAHIPDHVAPLDVGAFDETGRLVQMARGEIFFVTEYVPGRLYARDLSALQDEQEHAPLDRERAEALAGYLARVHARRVDPALYARDIRDTVGGGEGIFGIVDSYPLDHAVAGPERLRAIEHGALELRSELKRRPLRARRTHGDFHPFNILFREGTDFTVLDASRGGAGEPADDVTALSINYLFFELAQRGRFDGPLRGLWDRFWDVYLRRSKDRGVLEAAPLFFAWRGLVVASPVWYPDVDDAVRDRLLAFVERLVEGRAFDPFRVEDLLA